MIAANAVASAALSKSVQHGPAAERLKVFISYSRADTAFADELVAGLEYDGGFEVGIDRHAIHEGEAWEARLGALIVSADTIVFILSPNSAASKVCRWEVEEAGRNSKRILPVLAKPIGDLAPPPALAALNYVRFDPEPDGKPRSFMEGMAKLRDALRTDLGWLREHTRLMERASEWNGAQRVANRLLTGPDITTAKTWLAAKPQYAPEPTELHRDFIKASEEAETLRLSAERQRAEDLQRSVTRTRWALAGASVLALVAAGAGGLAVINQREALNQKHSAEEQTKVAQAEKSRAETAQQELAGNVKQLRETQSKLIEYTQQAGAASRDNAELKFKSILAKHGIDPTAQRPGHIVVELSDDEIIAHVSERAIELVASFEIISRKTYERKYSRPEAPGGASGITIGIGYDIGQSSKEEFVKTWQALLPAEDLQRLSAAVGVQGDAARAMQSQFSDITIPFDQAMTAFRHSTIPTYGRKILAAFPNSVSLPPDCFGALLSIVYNRGASLGGDKRKEMLAISRLIEIGEAQAVPEQIRTMKWIWEGKRGSEGVVKRREAEADLFEAGLATIGTAVEPKPAPP